MRQFIQAFQALSLNIKLFILLIILSLIGIAIRWDTVKDQSQRGFNYFKHDADTTQTIQK